MSVGRMIIRGGPGDLAGEASAALPVVDGYRIRRILGEGRTAVTYLAEDRRDGGRLALKVLKRLRAGGDACRRSFAAECAMVAMVRHEHVVRVVAHRAHADPPYLAMEYLEGGTLRERMRSPLCPDEAVSLLREAVAGIAAVHRKSIVHRDVKPENFLRRSSGALVLADFGVAARRGDRQAAAAEGRLVGTPCYVAPEQARGEPPEPTADVYSLGIMFYEMLCGHPPFAGTTPMELVAQHTVAPVPRLPGRLGAWEPLMATMLDKAPQRRPVDADAVLQALPHIAPALARTD